MSSFAASAMVIFVLIGFPLNLVLISPLGYYWGLLYVWAGKIWEENRMRAIGEIAILAAVLMGFAVMIEAAALPHWGAWVQDK